MKEVGPRFSAREAHLPSPKKGDYQVRIEFSATGLEYTGMPLINPEGTESHAIIDLSIDRNPPKHHSSNRIKTCTVKNLGISPHNDLTRMTTLAATLERTVRLCARNQISHLAFPLAHSAHHAQWLVLSFHVAGFRVCNHLQLPQTFRGTCFCLDLSTPNHSSQTGVPTLEPAQQIVPAITCAGPITVNAGDEQESFFSGPGFHGLTLSLPAPNPHTPAHLDTVTSQTSALRISKWHNNKAEKEYCPHWIRTRECNYMQQGCKYKHEIPIDPEARRKIGITHVPKWLLEGNQDGFEKLLALPSQGVKTGFGDMTVIGDGPADDDGDVVGDERVKAWLGWGKVVEKKGVYRPTHHWKRRYGGL